MSNAHNTTAEQTDGHTLFMLRSTRYTIILLELHATEPAQDAHLSASELIGLFTQPHIETKTARYTTLSPHRASCLYPLLYSLYCTRACVLSRSSGSRGVLFFSEGAAAEGGFVVMWRQEWAVVNKAYNALYRAQGLCKAVAAFMRVPAVPADFDRLISSGRSIHVALYRPHYFIITTVSS